MARKENLSAVRISYNPEQAGFQGGAWVGEFFFSFNSKEEGCCRAEQARRDGKISKPEAQALHRLIKYHRGIPETLPFDRSAQTVEEMVRRIQTGDRR